MFCCYCGAALPADTKFCPACGLPVASAPSATPPVASAEHAPQQVPLSPNMVSIATMTTEASAPVVETSQNVSPQPPKKKKKIIKKKTWIALLSVFLSLVLLAGLFCVFIPYLTDDPEPTEFKVTFNLNFPGATEIPSQIVKKDQFAIEPPMPSREGFEFIGWFADKNEQDWTKFYNFKETAVVSDLELFAFWVDMVTDSDRDELPDDIERYIGTNPQNADTDRDGLNDYLEHVVIQYSPLKSDSDSNGVPDPQEDYDDDGLINIDEVYRNTSLILKDTDNDGLTDNEEVKTYDTDPTKKDTDGDGAGDGDEVSMGTDPLRSNTSFVAKAEYGNLSGNQSVAVSVQTIVSGEQVGTLKIRPVSAIENPILSSKTPGYLDNAVDITIEGNISSAEMVFTYDTSLGLLGADFQPRVYYFNEATKTLDELPNQVVRNGTVTVTTEHFSTYILLNKVAFDKVWNEEIKKPIIDGSGSATTTLDVAFTIDVSGSMRNDRIATAKSALFNFINALGEKDRAALISFNSSATLRQGLTIDKQAVKSMVSNLYADGLTSMYNGLDKALDVLTDANETYGYKMIIILSDGMDEPSTNYDGYYADLVQTAKENGIVIYTIGVGDGIDPEMLARIADETDGAYYHATSADQITDIFYELQEDTVDLTTDSNSDGIPDYYNDLIKSGEMVLSNGSKEFMGIDFNYDENGNPSNDYDGDGIINGQELIIKENGKRVYMTMVSDPMMTHSDTDGYSDFQEHQQGSDPMIPSYERADVDYPLADGNFTYVDVLNEEDKWLNEFARETWSAITFNWSHVDEAKKLLVSFFETYSDLNSITSVSNHIEKEVSGLVADGVIAQLIDLVEVEDGIEDGVDGFAEMVKAMKKWKSAGNSAKNLSSDHFVQLKAQIGLFKRNYKCPGFDFQGITKMDKIGMGVFFVVDEVNSIYDWVKTYSGIVATQAAFTENQDILIEMIENDRIKERYIARAATDILYLVNGEYGKFVGVAARDLSVATIENIASLALSYFSAANPYVAAVSLLIGVIDLLTPATEIAEATYHLYVADELARASKSLFNAASFGNGFYNIEDGERRYLELLICARIYGGEFAKTITGNQIYLFANDDKVRKEYADIINSENNRLRNCLAHLRA